MAFLSVCNWLISVSSLRLRLDDASSGKPSPTLQIWLSYLFFVLPQVSVNTHVIACVIILTWWYLLPISYKRFEDNNLKPGPVKMLIQQTLDVMSSLS